MRMSRTASLRSEIQRFQGFTYRGVVVDQRTVAVCGSGSSMYSETVHDDCPPPGRSYLEMEPASGSSKVTSDETDLLEARLR